MRIGQVVLEGHCWWRRADWRWSVMRYGFVCHGVELHAGPLAVVVVWPRGKA